MFFPRSMPQNYVEVTMNSLGTEEQQYTKQWYTCLGVEGKLLYKDFINCAAHALTIGDVSDTPSHSALCFHCL